jgi:ABC-type Fe3+ transport system permease subunit
MGYHGMASEILIAFSARYDAALAAQKALLLALLLAPVVLPIAWLLARWSENHFLGRDLRRPQQNVRSGLSLVSAAVCAVVLLLVLLPPIAGFFRPLRSAPISDSFQIAWTVLLQSAPTTIQYSLTAAAIAVCLGMLLTLLGGANQRGRFLLLLFSFIILSLPPSLHALGFANMASHLPAFFDRFSRQDLAPGIALGLRLLPIPLLFSLYAWSLIPTSCHQTAALHGVPWFQYHWKVTLPRLSPALLISFLLVALVTAADVSSILVLLPPGAGTFSTRIFGIIDSTSERTLSVLCLVYLSAGLLILTLASLLSALVHRRTGN